jgi:Domain of unknown function (DUF4296)
MISKNNWLDMQIFRLLVFCISLLLCLGCNSERGFKRKYLIDKKEMVNILVDIHLANAIKSSPDFYKISREYDSVDINSPVFKKYGIEKARFDSSMVYYSSKPEVLTHIYDEVIMRLNQLQDTIKSKK